MGVAKTSIRYSFKRGWYQQANGIWFGRYMIWDAIERWYVDEDGIKKTFHSTIGVMRLIYLSPPNEMEKIAQHSSFIKKQLKLSLDRLNLDYDLYVNSLNDYVK